MNFIGNRNFRAGPQTSLEDFICPQNSDKQQKIKVFGRSEGGYCVACVILFLVIQYFSDNMLFRNIFCYNVFMVIGYCYYKQISKKMILLILSICIATMTLILSCTDMTFTPMHDPMFQPDYIFMVYNLIVLCCFCLVFSKV